VENVLHSRRQVKVFFEDGAGGRAEAVLGRWDCVSAPANVIHGFENVGLEPAYLQVMLGRARPDLMTYATPRCRRAVTPTWQSGGDGHFSYLNDTLTRARNAVTFAPSRSSRRAGSTSATLRSRRLFDAV